MERKRIKLQVAPFEAHTRLGIIETRHTVHRTAVEAHMGNANLEKNLEAVRETVNRVVPVVNTLSFWRLHTGSVGTERSSLANTCR